MRKNDVIVAGDFNAPDLKWKDSDTTNCSSNSERLLEIMDKRGLTQLVKEPTRGNNIIDLVTTNNDNIVNKVRVIPGISDHSMVLFEVNLSCKKRKPVKRKIYIKKRANSSLIQKELQDLAHETMKSKTTSTDTDKPVDEKWDEFERNIRRIMDTCIPHKTTSSRYNVPWFNRSLRRQTRTKQRLYNKAKKSGKSTHWNEFRAARKRLQKNLKSTREKYISDYLGGAIEENPKRFWTYIKQLKNDDPGVADFKVDGKIISDGKLKSEILSDRFSSV